MKISKVTTQDIPVLKKNPTQFGKFMKENDNFLNKIVHSFKEIDTETFMDLKQEARLALWQSLDDYDSNRGAKFITFAWTKIRNHVLYILQKKQKHDNSIISIEKFKKTDNQDSESDYYENAFDIDHFEFEPDIINKVDSERMMSCLTDLDKKILELKNDSRRFTRKEIAEHLGMNFHTFKFYYYGEFINKMQKVYGDKFENSFEARDERRSKYLRVKKGHKKIANKHSLDYYLKQNKEELNARRKNSKSKTKSKGSNL